MASITHNMKYHLSLIKYAEKFGVSKVAIKHTKKTASKFIAGNVVIMALLNPQGVFKKTPSSSKSAYSGRNQTYFRYAQAQPRCRSCNLRGKAPAKRLYQLYFRFIPFSAQKTVNVRKTYKPKICCQTIRKDELSRSAYSGGCEVCSFCIPCQ